MVKHIKKSYAKDGVLTKQEKAIAFATAWKDFNEQYPVYKTADYIERQDKGWSQKHKQIKATKALSKKILSKKVVSSTRKSTPSMKDVKDSMWGKGKHSTKRVAEGTFKQQFEPEYTEGKQRVKNAIRAKLGLKKGPQGDWKKEMKMRHARQAIIKTFRKEEVKFPKDYDPPKSWSKPPTSKELDQMAKHYSKKKKNKRGRSFRPSY